MKTILIRFKKRDSSKRTIPWHYGFYKDILEGQGHIVDILDNQVERKSIEETVDLVLRNGYELVGTGGIGTVYKEIKQFSELLKSKNKGIKIVVGGQVVADFKFVINSCPIDIIVLGEGEITLPKIVNCIESNGELADVPGIVFKKEDELVVTKKEKLISLDILPDLNIKNFKIELYDTNVPESFLVDEKARSLKGQGYRHLTIFLARGCPYDCFFCYRHIKGYRTYGAKRLEEILRSIKESGYSFFTFSDECLTANKKNLVDVCELAKKYEFYWFTNGRVDQIDHKTMQMLKESNCVGVQYGVESFDDDMLKTMNKKVASLQNVEAMNLNYQYGLKTVLQLVLGVPNEDRRTIFNTRKGMWSCYLPVDRIACAILNPYPGSKAYYYGIEKGYIEDKRYVHEQFAEKGEIIINFSKLSDLELKSWQIWLRCEAHISYRLKHLSLKIDRIFLYNFYQFAKTYGAMLLKEPLNFLKFNLYILKGFSYWFKPIKRLRWASCIDTKNRPQTVRPKSKL
jgi:radical SAM superfamily enzyme YgiQ (UPF0313 family)